MCLVTVSLGAIELCLFGMYNYTVASNPTRLCASGTGLTDEFGHLGAMFSPIIAGWLFTAASVFGHAG